jgi:hypothetical protein
MKCLSERSRSVNSNIEIRNSKQIRISNSLMFKKKSLEKVVLDILSFEFRICFGFRASNFEFSFAKIKHVPQYKFQWFYFLFSATPHLSAV